ncbi:hypothetical protein CsSME_00005258 [Camellia sinensis var. sinensis]
MHFFTLKLENRPPGAKIVQQPWDSPRNTSNTSGGTTLENRPPGAKIVQQPWDGLGSTSNTMGGTNPRGGPGNTSNTSGGTNVSCENLQNKHGTPGLKTKSKNATGGQNSATATGRPGEHIKHLGRDKCELWKLTELIRDLIWTCLTFFVDIRRHIFY